MDALAGMVAVPKKLLMLELSSNPPMVNFVSVVATGGLIREYDCIDPGVTARVELAARKSGSE